MYKKIINNIVFVNNNSSISVLGFFRFKNIIKAIDNLPKNISKRLQKGDILIRFTSKKEVEKICGKRCTGFFIQQDDIKIVYISNCIDYKNVLYHELGHVIDRCLYEKEVKKGEPISSFISINRDYFEPIYCNEKDVFYYDYYKSNKIEYFAQSFAEIINNNRKFMVKAELTTNFIKSCINSL